MTRSRPLPGCLVAAALAVLAAGSAHAQSTAPAPRPVLIQPTTSPQQRFRQAVQQSQVSDQLRKSQLEHTLIQQTIESTRRKPGSATSNDKQVDNAKLAQEQLYNAQQRDRVQRYSDALMAQPVPHAAATSAPARSSSAGGG